MSFSYNGYTFDFVANADKASTGITNGGSTAYIAWRSIGSEANVTDAAAALLSYFKQSDPNIDRKVQIEAEQINPRYVLLNASANARKLTVTSFGTTGGSTHINQSLQTLGTYAAPGKQAPNYRGAIGVSDSGVAGVDVTIPALEFSITKQFKFVSTQYLLAMVAMTGRINGGSWGIFGPGEVLFLGGQGSEDETSDWLSVTYSFAARPTETNLQIGNISGVTKRGWDYLWVRHEDEVVADRVLQVPVAAYVEQVYPEANFGVLGLL